jgi:hypothetical protein
MVGRTQGSLDETLGLDRSAAPPTLPDRLGHAQTPTQRLRSLELGFDQGFRQRVHHLDLQRLVYVEPFLGLGRSRALARPPCSTVAPKLTGADGLAKPTASTSLSNTSGASVSGHAGFRPPAPSLSSECPRSPMALAAVAPAGNGPLRCRLRSRHRAFCGRVIRECRCPRRGQSQGERPEFRKGVGHRTGARSSFTFETARAASGRRRWTWATAWPLRGVGGSEVGRIQALANAR